MAKSEPVAGRFSRQESRRVFGTRSPRHYFLIVCEGEKTEPLYFEGLKKDLPLGTLQIKIEIEGLGNNTVSLVAKAQKEKAKREKFGLQVDKLWVVFDRDAFPSAHFNEAIETCKREGFDCAWSNEAFELWYLLHFQYLNRQLVAPNTLKCSRSKSKDTVAKTSDIRKTTPVFTISSKPMATKTRLSKMLNDSSAFLKTVEILLTKTLVPQFTYWCKHCGL